MELAIFWFILSIVAGVIASAKGRSGFGYFFLSIVLSPLIGLILAAAMPRINPDLADPEPTTTGRVKCPHCAESVLRDAKVCKHCGRDIVRTTSCPACKAVANEGATVCAHCGCVL